MDDLRVGGIIRAVRRRRGWRQIDVARAAGVSQSTISLFERGHMLKLRIETARRICAALDVQLPFLPRWRGAALSTLLDESHARLVEAVVAVLRRYGWDVVVEYGFNHFGERGVVDVLAWSPGSDAILIIEVKSRIADVQGLLGSLDRKMRIVPRLVREQRRVRGVWVGRLVVAEESTSNRRVVARHPATFAAALPDRGRAVRRWLVRPSGSLAGLWFLSTIGPGDGTQRRGGPDRIRRPAGGP